jgi:hypothetical protein
VVVLGRIGDESSHGIETAHQVVEAGDSFVGNRHARLVGRSCKKLRAKVTWTYRTGSRELFLGRRQPCKQPEIVLLATAGDTGTLEISPYGLTDQSSLPAPLLRSCRARFLELLRRCFERCVDHARLCVLQGLVAFILTLGLRFRDLR